MEKVQGQIDVLIKLQQLDGEIYKLKEEGNAKPAETQGLKEAFAQQKQALKLQEDEVKSLQLRRKEHEIELATKEKEIKKYQTQLLQIKTNKEYMSLQNQIGGLKADNAVLEDDILELMEKIDAVKAEIAGERERLIAEEKSLNQEIERIAREVKEIDGKINSLEKERNQVCVNIDKGLLSRYERILKAKAGLALVPIVGESCGGCHQILPPQVVNEARMKDRLITCDFCARLLYWAD